MSDKKKYYGIAIYLKNRDDYRKLMVQEQDVILNIMNRCGIERKIEAVYDYNPEAIGWPNESVKAIGPANIDAPKLKDSMIILLDTEDSPELREKVKCFRKGLREHDILKTDFIGITFYYEFNNLTREKITIEPNTSSSMQQPPLPPLPPLPGPGTPFQNNTTSVSLLKPPLESQPTYSGPNAGGRRRKHKTKKSNTKKSKTKKSKTKKSRKQTHKK